MALRKTSFGASFLDHLSDFDLLPNSFRNSRSFAAGRRRRFRLSNALFVLDFNFAPGVPEARPRFSVLHFVFTKTKLTLITRRVTIRE
jgi:hypothetical protein